MTESSAKHNVTSNTSKLPSVITLLTFICTVVALFFSYYSYHTMQEVQKANENRYQSFLLADQLRLSSDQLTLMARTYAVTGNEKYLGFYNDILAIRNGTKARPENYHRVYWDLLMPEKGSAPFADGEINSFRHLMHKLGFTEQEFDFLEAAKNTSNQLTAIEFDAFIEVKIGLQKKGDYLQSEQRKKALTLLYSNEYFIEKAKIMSAINDFFYFHERRTDQLVESMQFQYYWATNSALLSFVLLVILLLYSLYLSYQSKVFFVQEMKKEVAKRTFELFEKREQLKVVIQEMELTKNQLVESEKMASLGSLVSGVAHEVNTPLGVSVTLASHLQDETNRLSENAVSGTLKRSELDSYCIESIENCTMLLANLERAADLIRSFKQVAVDQSSAEVRKFKISEYVHEVLLSLRSKLKKTQIKISVEVPEDEPEVKTYPGALAQIITNLVMNALIHAFKNGSEKGVIRFSIEFEQDDVKLSVADDGKGMEPAVCAKIFDPFFTTQRGSGGSGLGLNIVYNLVVHQLLGTISCRSTLGQGSVFNLRFPKRVNN
ncbi:sensor histidine kinase [Psychromonas aquimarina]|uniref:sensor histidine kinase n=1 Tax=Psychromonas aquimarina TaxID=444919 RepID=UPI000420FCA5|nr:HAMP domain-containing sensor histidine kinase [Psychromonas aquimarina]